VADGSRQNRKVVCRMQPLNHGGPTDPRVSTEGDVMAMAGWTTAAQIHKTYGAALASQRALQAGLAMPVDALLCRGRAS